MGEDKSNKSLTSYSPSTHKMIITTSMFGVTMFDGFARWVDNLKIVSTQNDSMTRWMGTPCWQIEVDYTIAQARALYLASIVI